jgi:hypothetical protein
MLPVLSSLEEHTATQEICSLLLSKIHNHGSNKTEHVPASTPATTTMTNAQPTQSQSTDPITFSAEETTALLQMIEEVQQSASLVRSEQRLTLSSSKKTSNPTKIKSSSKHFRYRRMSAFDHEREMDSQTEAIGYDLDSSTVKHVQHFTGMVDHDGVRNSSAHVIARLKHAVKHTIMLAHLKKGFSKEMIAMMKQQKSEGSHELHQDLDNIDEWSDFNIFHLLETFNGDRHLTVRSISVEILERRHGLLSKMSVNRRTFLNYVNKVSMIKNIVTCMVVIVVGVHCLMY